jgi:hypothetical protein
MVSSEVQPALEVMAFGPPPTSKRSVRVLVIIGVALALVLAAFGIWRLVPKPLPDFSTSDLEGVYTGMVRSDGTNDVSTLNRDQVREPPVSTTPVACSPLFDATISNQFPPAALDGVSTYWLNDGMSSISLLTYRYPDAVVAQHDYQAVATALRQCTGETITVGSTRNLRVRQRQVPGGNEVASYLSYAITTPGSRGQFSTDVFQLKNTVTWQYRYDYGNALAYSSVAAQQLMKSMMLQMRAVQQAHR